MSLDLSHLISPQQRLPHADSCSSSSDSEDDELDQSIFHFRVANPDINDIDRVLPKASKTNENESRTPSSSPTPGIESVNVYPASSSQQTDALSVDNCNTTNYDSPCFLSRHQSKTLGGSSPIEHHPSLPDIIEYQPNQQRASVVEPAITNTINLSTCSPIAPKSSSVSSISSLSPRPPSLVVPFPSIPPVTPPKDTCYNTNLNDARSTTSTTYTQEHHDQPNIGTSASGIATNPSTSCAIFNSSIVESSTHSQFGASSRSNNHTIHLSKYNIASYSLTNNPDAIKLYREMAEKTKDENIQLSYAKYLLQVADLYQPVMGSLDASKKSATATTINDDEDGMRKKKALEQEGIRWIRRLSKKGVGEAAYMEAVWMDSHQYGFKSRDGYRIERLYQIAAKAGIPEASYQLATRMEVSGQAPYDIFRLYQKAADQKCVQAVYRMAKIFLHGELDQKQNLVKGMDYLMHAVKNAIAACNEPPYVLALILTNKYSKLTVPSEISQLYGNMSDAIGYFVQSADLGNTGAKNRAGHIYEHGLYGAPMDFAKAFRYYDDAANQGQHLQSMLALSRLYNRGCHGPSDENEQGRLGSDVSGWLASQPKNEERAFYWCQRAAKNGLPDALYLLGWYYEIGLGAPRNYQYSVECYQQAARKGQTEAKERLGTRNSFTRQQHEEMFSKRDSTRSPTDFMDRRGKNGDDCILM